MRLQKMMEKYRNLWFAPEEQEQPGRDGGDERERAQAGEGKIWSSCWRDPAPWAWQGGFSCGTAVTLPHRITQDTQPSSLRGVGRGFTDGTGEWRRAPGEGLYLVAAHCQYLSALLQWQGFFSTRLQILTADSEIDRSSAGPGLCLINQQQLPGKPLCRREAAQAFPSSAQSLARLSGCCYHGDGAHGGEMGLDVFLMYKDVRMGKDAGWDGAVRHAAIPSFPISLGKPLPGLSLARAQGMCLASQPGSTEPEDKPLRPATPWMVLQPKSWVPPPWSPCKMGPGCLH